MKLKHLLLTALCAVMGIGSSWAQVTAGDYFIQNVESGQFLNGANDWGTKASVTKHGQKMTISAVEGGYNIDSHISNGGDKHFVNQGTNLYVDGVAATHTITDLGNGIFSIKDPNNKYLVQNDGTKVNFAADNADASSAKWKFISMEDVATLMGTATVEGPVDATYYIGDANFSRNNQYKTLWIVENCTNKNLGGGENNNFCAESYRSKFTIYQDLTVPNGVYALTAQGFYRQDGSDNENLPYFFANDVKRNVPLKTGSENSMSDASKSFTNGLYTIDPIYVQVTDGKLKVGIDNPNNASLWVIFDNFELKYFGDVSLNEVLLAEYVKAYKDAVEEATALLDEDMTDEAKAALNTAITNNTIDLSTATQEALETATTNLKEAIKDAREAIAEKARTQEALASSTIATDKMDGWRCTNSQTFHVNTWSTEGETDGSGMTTPFIENWVASGGKLGNGVISFRLVGLTPGDEYNFSALGRAIIEGTKDATLTGIKMFANETEIDLTEQGTAKTSGNNTLVYGTFTLEGTVDANGCLLIGFKINDTNCNWLAFKNVKFGKPIDIKKAELKEALDAFVVPTANVGDGAFQYPTDVIAELNTAKTAAQAVYDDAEATIEQVEAQIAAIEALELPALNAPAAGKKFHLAIKYNGYRYDGHALNLSSNGVAVPLADRTVNNNYPNDWTFTSVAGTKDGYTFSLTDENGTHYVCTGAQDKGSNDDQIRYTDDAEKALTIVVKPTKDEGVYTFLNTRKNNATIGCQDDRDSDGGWYTTGSHNTHTIVEATKASVALKVAAAKYATFVAPFNPVIPEGLKVYSCEETNENAVVLAEVTEGIKANTPYLVFSESEVTETLEDWGLATKDTYKGGLLTGVLKDTEATEGTYVLQTQNEKQGFYKVGADKKPNVTAYHAYLDLEVSSAAPAFYFDVETAIEAVEALTTGEAAIYDINGVKQQSLQKGINIVKLANGKTQKVLVK